MMFRRRYRQIGLFALPYQLLFEAMAPLIESVGYLIVPLTVATGLLSPVMALSFIALALALNVALTTGAILLAIHRRRGRALSDVTLFQYPRVRDTLVLIIAGEG